MRFTKEEFVNAIDTLYEMNKKAEIFSNITTEGEPTLLDEFISHYYDLISVVSDIEEVPYDDFENGIFFDDLNYFVWDLDFGNKYVPGMVTIDGQEISLRSASDCYDLLAKLNEERNEDK